MTKFFERLGTAIVDYVTPDTWGASLKTTVGIDCHMDYSVLVFKLEWGDQFY